MALAINISADETEPISVNITVPSELKIKMLGDGTDVISDYAITNNSSSIRLTNVSIDKLDDWSLVDDEALLTVDSHNMIFTMDDKILKEGDNALNVVINQNETYTPKFDIQRGLITSSEEVSAFKMKLNYDVLESKLAAGIDFNTAIRNIYTSGVSEIRFSHDPVPVDAKSVDVSLEQDGSVIAYFNDSDSSSDFYQYIVITNQNPNAKIIFNEDSSYMFQHLEGLTSIDFDPNTVDTSRIINMSHMFEGCLGQFDLGFNVDFSGWDTSNVTDMSYMFADTGGAGGIAKFYSDVSSLDTSSVVNMSHMFEDSVLYGRSLDLSSWNVSKVTDMSYMFNGVDNMPGAAATLGGYDSSKAIDFNVSGWNTLSVTNMSHMFADTGSITMLDLSSWNVSNVSNMDNFIKSTYTPRHGSKIKAIKTPYNIQPSETKQGGFGVHAPLYDNESGTVYKSGEFPMNNSASITLTDKKALDIANLNASMRADEVYSYGNIDSILDAINGLFDLESVYSGLLYERDYKLDLLDSNNNVITDVYSMPPQPYQVKMTLLNDNYFFQDNSKAAVIGIFDVSESYDVEFPPI